jgi:pyruvate/2-oxoglutarate dehydrogenase complex dihydrolipoamide dehydrogenase (E3) component
VPVRRVHPEQGDAGQCTCSAAGPAPHRARRRGGARQPRPGSGGVCGSERRRDKLSSHRDDAANAASVQARGVTLLRGTGHITGPGTAVVTAADGSQTELSWRDRVLTTGSVPAIPPVDGLDTVPTWISDQALSAAGYPGSLIVLGGGASELAQAYTAFGATVTLVEAAAQLVGQEEPQIAAGMARILTADGVRVKTGTPRPGRAGAGRRCTGAV